MTPFTSLSSVAIPFDREDVDTDAMVPQAWLITTERTGLGPALFANWRYGPDGTANPNFILNDARFANAAILFAGSNYGCGSSREHAVWAHLDYGIRAIVAPSFGSIFFNNALNNGLLTIALEGRIVAELMRQAAALAPASFTVDLLAKQVMDPHGRRNEFDMNEDSRQALLRGEDMIASTLRYADDIARFEREARS